MSQRFLIVVGLPKSGTTFLYAECAKRPDAFAMPIHVKEVDYLRRSSDRSAYETMFDPEGDKTIVDASPLYIDDVEQFSQNALHALSGSDVKIVVCLRDPLERAYSHYLHDIAQNQKLVGHADFSFFSPTVMAKYLFPLTPRIKLLQEKFGAENVFGFAFGSDMARFEARIRDFSGLEADWALDFSQNPAQGFTAPQTYYNADKVTELCLQGEYYTLAKGALLTVNRQFSLLRKKIHPPLAEHIMMRQSSLTRQFDTGTIPDTTRDIIYDDFDEAAELVGLDMAFDRTPRMLNAKPSEQLPDHILKALQHCGSLNDVVRMVMDTGLQPTSQNILEMPAFAPSLSHKMAAIQAQTGPKDTKTPSLYDLQSDIIENFGPIPHYMQALMTWHVKRKQYDEAIALFESYGGADKLLWPMDLAHFLSAHDITLPEDVARRFTKEGIRVEFPS